MSGWLDGPVLSVLEKGLDASSLRQKVLADNVANVDTPEFKRSDVNFQAVLDTALGGEAGTLPLRMTLPQHLPGLSGEAPAVVRDNSTTLRNDGNNVDIDVKWQMFENVLYIL